MYTSLPETPYSAAINLTISCRGKSDSKKSGKGDSAKGAKDIPEKRAKRTPKDFPAPPDVAAVPDDAQKSESGLAYKLLAPGTSDERPGPNDIVYARYTGWKSTGEMHNTTEIAERPHPMALARAPSGWAEALRMMTVGERRRLWMSPAQGKGVRREPLRKFNA